MSRARHARDCSSGLYEARSINLTITWISTGVDTTLNARGNLRCPILSRKGLACGLANASFETKGKVRVRGFGKR